VTFSFLQALRNHVLQKVPPLLHGEVPSSSGAASWGRLGSGLWFPVMLVSRMKLPWERDFLSPRAEKRKALCLSKPLHPLQPLRLLLKPLHLQAALPFEEGALAVAQQVWAPSALFQLLLLLLPSLAQLSLGSGLGSIVRKSLVELCCVLCSSDS